MRITQLACSLALSSLLGCAHAGAGPRAPEPQVASRAEQPTPERPVRVTVTGSRIPYHVDRGSNELPTDAPVRVYTRDSLNTTGRDGNVGDALRALDPSVTIHR
jgi:hypothetical protein